MKNNFAHLFMKCNKFWTSSKNNVSFYVFAFFLVIVAIILWYGQVAQVASDIGQYH